MKRMSYAALALILSLLVIAGCTKPYRITHDLERPLEGVTVIGVGEIRDDLPWTMEEEDKPSLEKIDKLRYELEDALMDSEQFHVLDLGDPSVKYEVVGSVLEYKEGSGVARFFIGFGVGDAKLTVELSLWDLTTRQTVFSAVFKRVIRDWAVAGDEMWGRVAREFVKALEKESEKLRRQQG